MTKPIQKIVVVGGGSAGWLAAAYLQRTLNRQNPTRVEISLIESPEIGIIGVGESTVPSLVNTLNFLGIDEAEFMRRTHATYKQAIRFVNWRQSPSIEPNNHFYHPFERPALIDDVPAYLARAGQADMRDPSRFAYEVAVQPWLADANRSPKSFQFKLVDYAYHIDAVLVGQYLREVSVGRGVIHIEDRVERISRDADGAIAALHTQAGRTLEADLFIDCSGFSSLLLKGVFEDPFISYKESLFCDRAVAIQVPTEPNREILPYTTSTAVSNGWIWDIQLQDRRGIGYVYSSGFIDDDAAEQELRAYIGPGANGLNSRRLRMRVGRSQNFWIKNCVALGLSSGFIEPLESTAIYLVEIGLKALMDNLTLDGIHESCIRNYNRSMGNYFDEIRDFITMHYCLTSREDTEFWRANKFNAALPDSLKNNLELWQHRYPSPFDDSKTGNFFTHSAYLYILGGMGKLPDLDVSYKGYVNGEKVRQACLNFERNRQKAVQIAPSHREFLSAMLKAGGH